MEKAVGLGARRPGDEPADELDLELEGADEREHGDGLEPYSDMDLADRLGRVDAADDGHELVLTWVRRDSSQPVVEALRYNRRTGLLRIFPRARRGTELENPFSNIGELQIEAPDWDPSNHTAEGERYGLLHVVGLPRGFAAVYEFGLGISRDYRGLVDEVEERTGCATVRFVSSGPEGLDGEIFRLSLERFERFRAVVDLNRGRGATAVRRVNTAERHNAVADLFGLAMVEPRYGRNPVIRAITEEIATGHVTDASDRAALVNEVARQAPAVAQEAPEQFGRLREDIELVSLAVLIERFQEGLVGRAAKDEGRWQRFFADNSFALQQVFSAPILVLRGQVHVRGSGPLGDGSRIADFLCVNAVTRTAVVVEIKTPASPLMAVKPYRGSGSAAVHPAHRELSGAVGQVQAQMESVPRDLRDSPEFGAVDKWHVRGAVISGRVSGLDDEQRESFLRYREGLSSVTVLGYDEICERLKGLHALLSGPPAASGP